MDKIIAQIYLIVGFITAILDSLDIFKISLIGYQANLCALGGNINCGIEGITNILIFAVNIIFGPVFLAAKIVNNPTLGIFGAFIAFFILWYSYGRKE